MYLSSIASAALIAIVSTSCLLGTEAAVVPPNNEGIVRLPLIRNSNGQLAQLRRFESTPLEKRDATRSSIYNAFGREYLIEAGVGTPPQSFNLTLDTGSAEFWVPSIACPTSSCPYERFDGKKSSTFESNTEIFSIEYGIGSATGNYGIDTVTVGTAKVDKQKIGLASGTKNILGVVSSGEQCNGILGLGFPGLNSARGASNVEPFPFNLGKTLDDQVFSIFLNSHYSYGMSGEIVFGGIDTSKFTGELQYVPVVTYDTANYLVSPNVGADSKRTGGTYLYWSVAGQGVKVNNYQKSFTPQAFILDTGTTLTMVPKTYAEGILEAATGSKSKYSWDELNGVYRVDCNLKKSTVNIEFQISTSTESASQNAVTISTPVKEMIIPLDTDYLDTATACMFGITASSSGLTAGESWIIGEASLRSMYLVHDMKNNQVGLAPVNLAGAGQFTPASSAGKTEGGTSSTNDNNDNSDNNDSKTEQQKSNASKSQDESAASTFKIINVVAGATVSAIASYWLM